jgi:adenylate kinase
MSEKIYKIIFLGPQGSGKGTQAELLAKKLNLPNISVGNLFRNHIKNKTELGELAKRIINKGDLMPSELTNEIVIKRLQENDCQNGFILDGYPRDHEQFSAFNKFTKLTHAIEVWISDEEAVERLGGRRSCDCGATYHLKYNPPKNDEVCDNCGHKLYIRDDDTPEAINQRLAIYHNETEPLIKLYQEQKILIKINGEQSIEKVNQDILKAMGLV